MRGLTGTVRARPGSPPHGATLLTLGAFVAAVLLGGTNFVAIRFSNRELEPLWGAGFRFTLAALVFVLVLLAMRFRFPRWRDLRMPVVFGLLAFGAAYGLLYTAMQTIPAGLAATVMAAGPMLTLVLASMQRLEPFHPRLLAGGAIALAGSAIIFLRPGETRFGWREMLAVLLAAAAAAESVVVAKRIAHHPFVTNAVGMAAGGLALLALSALSGEAWLLPAGAPTRLAVGYLVLSSVLMFALFFVVVRAWSASATSYVFVLMPPVAVVLGALLGGEPIAVTTVVGGLVILAGVYYAALRRRTPSTAEA